MDNEAFEMHGETFRGSSEELKKEVLKPSWSLLKVFLVCLLAGLLSTALGVLGLSLVYGGSGPTSRRGMDLPKELPPSPGPEEKSLEAKFQFLNHLKSSKELQGPFQELQVLLVPQGSAWVGVISADAEVATFNVSAGQVVFFPRNSVHWIKNVGPQDCLFLLFFSTHEELETLELDEVFFSTPEDVVARALKSRGGVNFIRTFKKPREAQALNLPANLEELLHNVTYGQTPAHLVWRFFYDLRGSATFPFPGGSFQWARYRRDPSGLSALEKIFSQSLNQHEDTLTLAALRLSTNSLGHPHFHPNANELGYVVSGCGQAGLVVPQGASDFNVDVGDVVFFPEGTQHFLKSTCQEDLLLLLAYSTGQQLETLRLRDYFKGTADHVLAQLFHKDQRDFQKIP
ncbi:oxalate decarboxylase OxdD-like isoform X1 [Phaenicophaeus curvirostris]|uniref:oxalate decarboxylase OxdD-like isoform X1 n=1 Tax=Phaenicophaeus curvirostris TaxID=33595 RepID=UPI0037F0FAB4